ncbi:hypothetical protein [Pseudomonas sp. ABFPK]|uniref:hypothetical protein n=1 Tax=Pseudomonas sp. ABFPK TaxID=1636605 RepID=UPI000778EAF7|nr:hypothetical protein [Pseudomonas sp. ABFPK]KYC14222.1 hypothetical protein WM94_27145 [Pseudomonas sp. ABFPK]
MSDSISGTVNPPALPPVSFSLEVYGSAARRFERDAAKQHADEAAAHRAKIRRLREETELLAAEHALVMQRKHIEEALNPATDPKLRRDLRNDVMNRGIGRPSEAEQDDPKDKEARARDLLEILATVSTRNFALEQQGKAAPRIEKDVTPGQGQHLGVDLSEFNAEDE